MTEATVARIAAEAAYMANPSHETLKAMQLASDVEMEEVLANLDSKPYVYDHTHSGDNCETCADRFTFENSTI